MPVLDYARFVAPAAPSAAYLRAVRHVRLSVLIWLAAGGIWLAGLLFLGIRQRVLDGQWPSMMDIEATVFGIVLVVSSLALWLGPPSVRLAFSVLHWPLKWRVPRGGVERRCVRRPMAAAVGDGSSGFDDFVKQEVVFALMAA